MLLKLKKCDFGQLGFFSYHISWGAASERHIPAAGGVTWQCMSKGHLLSVSMSPLLQAPGSAYIPAELRPFLQSLLGPHSSWDIRILSARTLISQILYPSEGRPSPALSAGMHYLAISSLGSQPPPRGSAWEERNGPSESQMPQTCWGSSLEPLPGSAGKEGPGSMFTRNPNTDTPFLPSACLPPGHLGYLGRGTLCLLRASSPKALGWQCSSFLLILKRKYLDKTPFLSLLFVTYPCCVCEDDLGCKEHVLNKELQKRKTNPKS